MARLSTDDEPPPLIKSADGGGGGGGGHGGDGGDGDSPLRRTTNTLKSGRVNGQEHDGSDPHDVYFSGRSNVHSSPAGPELDAAMPEEDEGTRERFRFKSVAFVSVIILFFVNLLNYMDRMTVAGVLVDVKTFYDIDNANSGLLQTSFVCSYMILAPIFGYLGDRYNRKYIMSTGIAFWCATTLIGSFIPKEHFWWFLACRGLVGIGEASYSTIAPTIIADLYKGSDRSRMLAIFYFAIPVGSGLGFVIGSNVAKALGNWKWALRVTPPLGFICVLLVIFVMKEPPRGENEGGKELHPSSWTEDILSLFKNASFIWSTFGFTCVAFVAGALSWWGPTFLMASISVQQEEVPQLSTVSLYFGIITVIAGIVGVASGSFGSQYLKRKYPAADPLICAFGMVGCMPFLFFGAIVSQYNTPAVYTLIFFGEILLCLNWSIVADILLYVVIPTRRSTAEAFQILLSHALGDAGSPYIIGLVSDAVAHDRPANDMTKFLSLQYALFITCFVCVVGGFCFLITAWYIVEDKRRADDIIKEMDSMIASNSMSISTSISNGNFNKDVPPDHGEGGTKIVNGIQRTSL